MTKPRAWDGQLSFRACALHANPCSRLANPHRRNRHRLLPLQSRRQLPSPSTAVDLDSRRQLGHRTAARRLGLEPGYVLRVGWSSAFGEKLSGAYAAATGTTKRGIRLARPEALWGYHADTSSTKMKHAPARGTCGPLLVLRKSLGVRVHSPVSREIDRKEADSGKTGCDHPVCSPAARCYHADFPDDPRPLPHIGRS